VSPNIKPPKCLQKGKPYYVLLLDLEDSFTCHGKMKTKEFSFCYNFALFDLIVILKHLASTNPNLKHLESVTIDGVLFHMLAMYHSMH